MALSTPSQADEPVSGNETLILAVSVNGARSPLLWQFTLLPNGGLAVSADRLRQLGLDLRRLEVAPEAALVPLDGLAGVRYRYSEADQSVDIDVTDNSMVPAVLDSDSAPEPLDIDRIATNTGLVLNYGLYIDVSGQAVRSQGQYDLRLLSRFGVVSATGYATWVSKGPDGFQHVRLDTNWRYVDARRAIALTVGDLIGNGGQFGTAYRLGGIQLSRDYGNRPDLVTTALPILNGSAAVPSTVDLYVNGLRYYTGEVGRGPFQFRSLPNIGGGATATILMTDAAGQETRVTKPIFFVPGLLPPGKLDFSVETGYPRLYYGTKSFAYLDEIAGSASVRYGFTDWLTLLAHAERLPDLINGSLGATVRIGGIGSVTGGGAASRLNGLISTHYSADAQWRIAGIDFYGGFDRAKSGYQDVVTLSALRAGIAPPDQQSGPIADPRAPLLRAFSRKTERAGMSFSLLRTGFSLNYTRLRFPRLDIRPVSASINRTIFGGVSIWANGYKDFGDRRDYGVYLGFSLIFGKGIAASSSLAKTAGSAAISTHLSHDPPPADGGLGWSVIDNEPISGGLDALRSVNLRYLTQSAVFGAGVEQYGSAVRATGYVEGAIVAMGGLYFSQRIDNSFAVVRDAGPDTPVLANTRKAARTNSDGRALVTNLASFDANIVSIDPANLPIDLKPARTEAAVIPGDRAGVIIDFGVAVALEAIVVLVDAGGQPLPVGAFISREGSSDTAVVGYDGRAYLTGLSPHNQIRVEREGAPACTASFDFKPMPGQQALIGPVTCR